MDLISRQDAIDAIRAFYDEYIIYDNGKSIEDLISELPSAQRYTDEEIQKMQDLEQAMISKAFQLGQQDAQQWIPVTEQTLPNHNSVVIVCGEKGTWDFGTYRGLASTNVNFWNWKKNTVKEVHWWMYKEDALPMPWEGGEA